jgi:opacity protein-like surface antigen
LDQKKKRIGFCPVQGKQKMTNTRLVASAAIAMSAIFGATTAMAEEEKGGFYVGIGGGANWLDEAEGNGVSIDFDTGYTALAAVGYDFGVNGAGGSIRVEGEVSYTSNDYSSVTVNGVNTGITGDIEQWTFMGQGIYEFTAATGFRPYVGAGIGVINAETEASAGNVGASADSTEFAYRGLIGVAADVTESATLDLGFRYTGATGDAELDNIGIVAQVRFGF